MENKETPDTKEVREAKMVRVTFQERCYQIIGLVFSCGGVLGIFSQLYDPSGMFVGASLALFYVGVVVVLIGESKRAKRIRSLPPCS